MSEKIKLKAKERDMATRPGKLRQAGSIPAVIYSKGNQAMPLVIDAHEFEICHRKAGGNTVLTIEIERKDGTSEKKNALIHMIDLDPVRDKALHADLLQIKMTEKITATIPLTFTGDSLAVIEQGGSLLTQKSEVEVECLPGDLPHEILVDVSLLSDFDKAIHVSDLPLAQGVAILDEPDEVIAYVEAPRTEEELAELEEPVAAEEMPPAEQGEAEAEDGEVIQAEPATEDEKKE